MELSLQAREQSLPESLSKELRALLIGSTHRVSKAREVSFKYLHKLITSFPALLCDPPLVFAILEVLTLLRRAGEEEFIDEVCRSLPSGLLCVLMVTSLSTILFTNSTLRGRR